MSINWIIGIICAALVTVSLMAALIRVYVGPDDANRAVGSDQIFFSVVALFALGGMITQTPYAFDLIMVASTVGFLATLAMARAILRGRR